MTICAALCSGVGHDERQSETTVSARNALTTIAPSGASIATIKTSGVITPNKNTVSGKPSRAQRMASGQDTFSREKMR